MVEMELQGMQELLNRIAELGKRGSKIENEALLKAAQPILADAVENVPVHTGKGRSMLKISRPKSKGDNKYVLVGMDKEDISEIFYLKFHEFGTSKLPARPFLGPAYERNKAQAIEIIKEEFRRGLSI